MSKARPCSCCRRTIWSAWSASDKCHVLLWQLSQPRSLWVCSVCSMSNVLGEAVEKELAKAEQIERWPAGMVLFNQGEAPRGLFVIHSGVVDLELSGRN